MSEQAILAIVTLVLGGGFVGALVAAYRARPERDSVVVTTAMNAQEMLRGMATAVHEDWQRERVERQRLDGVVNDLEAEIDRLEARIKQLEARGG